MEEKLAANAAAAQTPADAEPLTPTPDALEAADAGTAAGTPDERAAPPPDPDPHAPTKAFSDRLNRMSRRAVDDFVASLGLRDQTTGAPIATREQYEANVRSQPAAPPPAADADPAAPLTEELSSLRGEVESLRLQQQDEALLHDPVRAAAYRPVREQVLELARFCREDGRPEVDVESAFAYVLQKNCAAVFRGIEKQAQDAAVRRMTAAVRASVGRLGGGDVPGTPDYAAMSDEEFDRQLALARRGGLRAK